MHLLTRHIVSAENKDAALLRAANNARLLCQIQYDRLDWYDTKPRRFKDSGRAYPAGSSNGLQQLAQALEETYATNPRRQMQGHPFWIYDDNAHPLRTHGAVDTALVAPARQAGHALFVVLIDMHW